jgi:hypothetical protein
VQSLDEHQAALAKAIRSVCEQEQSATHRENGLARDRCHFRTREDQIGANAVVKRDVDCGDFKSPLALVLEFPRKEALQQSIQRSTCGVHRRHPQAIRDWTVGIAPTY